LASGLGAPKEKACLACGQTDDSGCRVVDDKVRIRDFPLIALDGNVAKGIAAP
jgi:hypothetical protein